MWVVWCVPQRYAAPSLMQQGGFVNPFLCLITVTMSACKPILKYRNVRLQVVNNTNKGALSMKRSSWIVLPLTLICLAAAAIGSQGAVTTVSDAELKGITAGACSCMLRGSCLGKNCPTAGSVCSTAGLACQYCSGSGTTDYADDADVDSKLTPLSGNCGVFYQGTCNAQLVCAASAPTAQVHIALAER
jgi:hypothetical protein